MNHCVAILLDTVSIQDYIFQSNQLKENIGASFLVDEIYKSYLKSAVEHVLKKEVDLALWWRNPNSVRIATELFEVGFIGGGNALLLFQDKDNAKQFIKVWTTALLTYAPGITTAVACDDKFDLDHYHDSKQKLFRQLRENKGWYIPDTIIPSHGMTAECRRSGLSANIDILNPQKEIEYVSASTHAKIKAAEEAQQRLLKDKEYQKLLGNKFCFTADIGKLGQKEGEDSHISIVHIDGNDMGERFNKTNTLPEDRMLSIEVHKATYNAFQHLIGHITKRFQDLKTDKDFCLSKEDDKYVLPIRSIVLGGDDVTFVCDGRLGLYFAKIFIEEFQRQKVNEEKDLTACVGIAIIKTKYPFSRGYDLAEKLCSHAKMIRRTRGDSCSYLDFHLSHGGLTGSPEDIRNRHFQVEQGNLMYRPYKLVPKETKDEYSFDMLLEKATELQPPRLPRNKMYEFREMLALSRDATERFVHDLKFRGRELPQIPGRFYHIAGFDNGKTPYFDMIELLELYPQFALQDMEVHDDKL